MRHPIAKEKSRISDHAKRRIMQLALDPRMTFKLIAEEVRLSRTSVIKIFYETLPHHNPILPYVLSLDEVYLGRKSKRKFSVVLMNFQTHEVIDLIYGRSVDDCISALDSFTPEERSVVRYISSDMYKGFFKLAARRFPNALICVDSFHIIKLINDAFRNHIVSIMKKHDNKSIEYYLLKNYRYLLFKDSSEIEWINRNYNRKLKYYISNTKLLELVVDTDSNIKISYLLKNRYIKFNKMRFDKDNGSLKIRAELKELITEFANSELSDFRRISNTLNQNSEYIINSFTRINGKRISNGPIESRNATIKMILKTSGGYRNFEHLRRRALYVLNKK
ncbi:MAG: ISL3 family transposase [Erysipelothrix sp.]|nr:ISL3 family transposase [Erysipelothrix sp.]